MISYRNFQKADIPAVVTVAAAIAHHQGDAEHISADQLNYMVAAPHLHPEEDFFVALTDDGELVGASMIMLRPGTGMAFGDVMLHPDHRVSSIVSELIQRSEQRVLHRANAEMPDEPMIQIGMSANEHRHYLRDGLLASGYTEVRRQYVMRRALDTPIARPEFPAGFELRPFDQTRDARAVHAVFQECFADHWGGVGQMPYEEWAHRMSDPDFDPTMWYILHHDDAIAAICLCEPYRKEPEAGWVEILGVRPVMQRRGLGGKLLQHAFYDFQQRSLQHAALDVDAENTSDALALYQKAGMVVKNCTIHYGKVLRGDPSAHPA